MMHIHNLQHFATRTPAEDLGKAMSAELNACATSEVLLLLSGGSAFSVLDYINTETLSARVTISVLDERYTQDIENSNVAQLRKTAFFAALEDAQASFFDPSPQERESIEKCANRFDAFLKNWHTKHPKGVVFALLGMGADGHTSGVLPAPPEKKEWFQKTFIDTDRYVVGYTIDNTSENPHKDRITTTLHYLQKQVQYAYVYATGEEKKQVIQKLEGIDVDTLQLSVFPAGCFFHMNAVSIYTK